MLQIELLIHTHVRAHDLNRTETGSVIITSQANMAVRLGSGGEKADADLEVPSRLWDNIALPNTIAPTFETCNISRTYDLEVRVGLKHGGVGDIRPEIMVLPLRLAVKIFSGIKPPAALLRAIATSQPQHYSPTPISLASPTVHSPSSPSTPSYVQHPPQIGSFASPQQVPFEDDAPPSYEDAMADEVGPVDGPRRDYNIPTEPNRPVTRASTGFNDESKGSGLARQPSERLFPQNGIQSHSRASSYAASATGDGQVPISPIISPISGNAPPFPPRPQTAYEQDREKRQDG